MNKNKVQVVIYLHDENKQKVFLFLQMNEKRNLYWQNITGGVEPAEAFFDAAIRESVEETGLPKSLIKKIEELPLEFKFTDQWKNNVTERCFAIEVKSKWDIILDPSEHINFKWEADLDKANLHYPGNQEVALFVEDNL